MLNGAVDNCTDFGSPSIFVIPNHPITEAFRELKKRGRGIICLSLRYTEIILNNGERVSLLEEGIQLLHMLWSKPSMTFEGRHFKVKEAALLKNQTKTQNDAFPITISAKQDKTTQIAAKYAQGWESSYLTPEQFTSLNEKFESICQRPIEMESEE